ncbi:glutathione S-transferase T3-like [Spinacia oleracea]|uniref:Glutathione S-transferase T3-like n=1 Tax=Spinacia oleracea TaxID=3562 RepID=A0A9R0ITU5_SPIOL|nr:glutathione S-transferase T3-like [Spinacia oleracea]
MDNVKDNTNQTSHAPSFSHPQPFPIRQVLHHPTQSYYPMTPYPPNTQMYRPHSEYTVIGPDNPPTQSGFFPSPPYLNEPNVPTNTIMYHPHTEYTIRPDNCPTHSGIFSHPPYLHEPNIVHDNTRRDSIGDSSTNEMYPTTRLGDNSQAPQTDSHHEEETNQAKEKRTKLKWSQNKDVDLCTSWITISKDPIKGIDQTKELYWRNIAEYYNTWKKKGPEIPVDKLSNHWFKMSAEVTRFNGCYNIVKDSHPSGHNNEDIINKAKILFAERYENRKFSYLHAWEVLHTDPKWQVFSRK